VRPSRNCSSSNARRSYWLRAPAFVRGGRPNLRVRGRNRQKPSFRVRSRLDATRLARSSSALGQATDLKIGIAVDELNGDSSASCVGHRRGYLCPNRGHIVAGRRRRRYWRAIAAGRAHTGADAQRVMAGVVNIANRARVAQEPNPLLNDPVFRRFSLKCRQSARYAPRAALLWTDRKGLAVTNNHIIEHADEIAGTCTARQSAQTRPRTSRSQDFYFVVAIGTPFGLGEAVTSGISGSSRARSGEEINFPRKCVLAGGFAWPAVGSGVICRCKVAAVRLCQRR